MYEYKATVLKILDGDTLDVDIDLGFSVILHKQRIRMLGIDTPETRTKDKEEKKLGMLAKKRLKELCPTGSTITVETELEEKGKFGRVLGIISTLEHENINTLMIAEGHAKEYYGGKR